MNLNIKEEIKYLPILTRLRHSLRGLAIGVYDDHTEFRCQLDKYIISGYFNFHKKSRKSKKNRAIRDSNPCPHTCWEA